MSQTVPFTKQPKTNEELADLLISRNLAADRHKAIHLLDSIGYYRLTGYLAPFKMPGTDNYLIGTTLDQIWDIYTFDRHLRLMAMDALARIEVAVRALLVKFHTANNPDPFAYVQHNNLPNITAQQHASLLSHISSAIGKAKDEPDIRHFLVKYGIGDYPPVWAMLEHVPMGSVTFYYEGLPVNVQQSLSNTFYVRPSAFIALLMTLKNARNTCAHHSRFWNRHMKARISRRLGSDPRLAPFVECLDRQPSFTYTTTFTVLSLCAYCMGIIRPESKWKERCHALLKTATPFVLRGMGAPADWDSLALWQQPPPAATAVETD